MVTSIVLAGGRSQRLGRNKIMEKLEGRTLIEWVVECLAPISDQIIISTIPEQKLPHFNHDVEIIYDVYPGKASLGGLYSGIKAARSYHSLAVAADMPFLNRTLLRYMLEIAADYDVVIPKLRGFIEPLHAVYSKKCIAPIEVQIKRDHLKIREFLSLMKVHYMDEAEFEKYDPEHMSLFNINTMDDLKKAKDFVYQQRKNK